MAGPFAGSGAMAAASAIASSAISTRYASRSGSGVILADGSPEQLARQLAGDSEVRWSAAGQRFVHPTRDATHFVRELLSQPSADIVDLEVRRSSIEDVYLAMVAHRELGARPPR